MGECTDILKQILSFIQAGINVKDSSNAAINPAREDGNLKTATEQLAKFDFDGASRLNVNANLTVSDLEIGGVEIQDQTTSQRATIEQDGSKGAIYVQSMSLLKTTDFKTIMGEALEAPAQYSVAWRLSDLQTDMGAIKTQLANLTFSSSNLSVVATIPDNTARELGKVQIESAGSVISPATEGTLSTIKTDVETIKSQAGISNAIVATKTISFGASQSANVVVSAADIPIPTALKKQYLINIVNPSIETDVDIQLYLKETFDSTVVWCKLGDNFTVIKGPDARSRRSLAILDNTVARFFMEEESST